MLSINKEGLEHASFEGWGWKVKDTFQQLVWF